jgi:hypothetical protein
MQSTWYQEADDEEEPEEDDLDALDEEKEEEESDDEDDSEEDDKKTSKSSKKEKDQEEDIDVDEEKDDKDDEDKDDEKADKEKDKDDDDDSAEDDKELDDDDEEIEESYVEDWMGALNSFFYREMDESYDGPGGVSNSKHKQLKDSDEKIEWEVKPGKEVEDIKFEESRKKTMEKLEKEFGKPKKSTMELDDYGKFIVYYENDKVAKVTIVKDIEVELDRSIVFPGKTDNIRKKALDIRPGEDGKLISRIMSVEVETNFDETIKSITFARHQYFSDKQHQVFDKVKWHTSNGMDEKDTIKKFKEVYKFLDKHSLLTPTGKEEMKHLGPDSILTSNEVNEKGNQFLKIYYDKCKDCDYKITRTQLEQYWMQFSSQSYTKGDSSRYN